MAAHNDDAMIRERAYRIWEEAGRPHGLDQEHWHAAERELDLGRAHSDPALRDVEPGSDADTETTRR